MVVFFKKHCGYLIMTMIITAINSRCFCVPLLQLEISLDILTLAYLVVDHLRKCLLAFT